MKITKKIVSYVITFLTVFSSFTILPSEFFHNVGVSAFDISVVDNTEKQTYTSSKLIYTIIDDDELELAGYDSTAYEIPKLKIPDVLSSTKYPELSGRKITAIGSKAFYNKYFVNGNLTFGKNIKTIGYAAFEYVSGLRSLVLPESLETLGINAFSYSDVESITFGKNLKQIGTLAFANCRYLSHVYIDKGNDITIYFGAFQDCEGLNYVTIKGGVKKIDTLAFDGCDNLKYADIGNSVRSIGNKAFQSCYNLYKIDFGESVTSIGSNVFKSCNRIETINLFGKEIKSLTSDSLPKSKTCTIYCYQNTITHSNLVKNGYTNIKFFESSFSPANITVNGLGINNFNSETRDYTVYVDDVTNVTIAPEFKIDNVKYKINGKNNVYTLNVYNDNKRIIEVYKINIKECNYTVTGNISLVLKDMGSNNLCRSVYLDAGTYKFKIAKGERHFGYNKTFTDYCKGITLNEKYKSEITLNATGGIYTFQFNKETNKLVVKHIK